ncbi:MAG: hypothetical protein LBC67_01860 [Spirochaetales bacterium]|jgi:hypothetical protein|nr:hypothetical protein [Spirochaetales bacterium]
MYQIYYLSVTVNLIVGIALSAKLIESKFPAVGKMIDAFAENGVLRLWLGILATAVGVLKLLLVTDGDMRIVGDLFPALAGIFAGLSLVLEHYREKGAVFAPMVSRAADFLIGYKPLWGILAFAAAVLHFLFHGALFL